MPASTTASPTACSMSIRPRCRRALDGASPPFVPDVVADDPVLAGLLREAFADFPQPLEPLAVDAVVERLAGRLAARSDDRPRARRSADGASRGRARPRVPRRRSASHGGVGGARDG